VAKSIVIIPTYNERENIEKIIRKVFSLSIYFELLVVEDNSPDGTAAIVKSLLTEFQENRVWEQPTSLGLNGLSPTNMIISLKWTPIFRTTPRIWFTCTMPVPKGAQIWRSDRGINPE